MTIKESIKNALDHIKSITQPPIDAKDFVKKEALKEYVKEADLIQAINEAVEETFNEAVKETPKE